MAHYIGCMKIVVQVDSKRVVIEFQEHHKEHGKGINLLRKIRKVGNNFEEIRMKHIFREVNRCADMLAK